MVNTRRSLLISVLVGSGMFFMFGEWLGDILFNYGFALFGEPSVAQRMAVIATGAIYFPVGMFFESLPYWRIWLAVNGAFWGIVLYVVWISIAKLWRKRGEYLA